MTLPFRRRHHDAEAGHDRARMLMSEALLVTLAADDAAWLGRHLDGCAECGRDWKAYRADHRLLRTLRNQPIEPPRDLWARTSAALDHEAQRRGPASGPSRRPAARGWWQAMPLGAIAGVLVVAVLVGSRVFDRGIPPASAAPGTNVAILPSAGPTGLAVPDADPVAIFRETAAGSWELVYEDVKEYCVQADRSCAPKKGGKGQSIDLGDRPSEVALGDGQLAIAAEPEDGSGGSVFVVPVEGPGATPGPSQQVTDPPTSSPTTGETPVPTPYGAIAIASGVHVVGDVAYSEDGAWLAFSAAPADDSTGPDLYVWAVGDEAATRVTDDHQTYFSSWHRGRILASRVELPDTPSAQSPLPGPESSASPDASTKPGRGNQGGDRQGSKPRATESPTAPPPSATTGPDGSGSPDRSAAPPIEGHPSSFLLDPASLERTDLAARDVWLPVLDPSGRNVVYWSGTLLSEDGRSWALGTGEVVLDGWASGEGSAGPTVQPTPRSADATSDPSPAVLPIGPVGAPKTLVPGRKATFKASFDPAGTRLAIWFSEGLGDDVGRLHLVVLDPATGEITGRSPLEGEAALRRFTIDKGRLAWVTPSGQNGRESLVHVLGWKGDNFGEIETEPASDLYLP